MSLPPPGLHGLEPQWSREVTGVDSTGVSRTWHVLDSHATASDADRAATRGTLLCVHGNPTWSYLWRRVVATPPPGWRVVAVDQLDMGFSDRTGTVRPLAQRVDDLDSLTDALGLTGPGERPRIITVAHDWGGPISLGWAERHVDQLDGVVLANTAVHQPKNAPAPRVIRAARLPGMLPGVTSRSRMFIRSAMFMSRPLPAVPIRKGYYAPYATTERRAAIEWFVRDIPLDPTDVSAAPLDSIAAGLADLRDVPVLLLWGPSDPVFSDLYLRDLIERLPHADVHRYEGSSHLVPEDAPTFAADVARWVSTRSLGAVSLADSEAGHRAAGDATAAPAPAAAATELGPHVWSAIVSRAANPVMAALPAVMEFDETGQASTITFAELDRRTAHIAAGLRASGVQPGDRIALLVPPGADLTATLYGIWRAGAVAVVVDAGLGLRGMRVALRSAGPKYLMGVAKGLVAARLMATGAELIAVGPIPHALRRSLRVRTTLADIEARGSLADVPPPPFEDEPAAIAFTSGATGPAKGALYLHRQLRAQRDALATLYGIGPDDRLVAAFGVFALFGAALGIPSAVPDMDLTAPRTLTARALGEAAAGLGATMVFASPAALANVAATASGVTPAGAAALAQVRLLLSTGAPVPAELLRTVRDGLLPNAEAHAPYGMTEVLPVADIELADMEAAGVGNGTCVGHPVPGVGVRIAPLDAAGRPTDELTDGAGVTGEVCVAAAHTKDRYDRLWVTEDAASRHRGWHRTGDVGHFDDAGRLWIEGRLVHVIVTAGGPVTPVGIERRAESVPGVARAAAVGVGPPGAAQLVVVAEVSDAESVEAPPALRDAVRTAIAEALPTAPAVVAVLLTKHLPVDIRHNSKIDRVAVADWATGVLNGKRVSSR